LSIKHKKNGSSLNATALRWMDMRLDSRRFHCRLVARRFIHTITLSCQSSLSFLRPHATGSKATFT